MLLPTVYELEQRFLPMLRGRFPSLSVEQEQDGEFSHLEIVLNEERNLSVYIDSEALEVRLEYAFFRFLFGEADLLDYKVVAENYRQKGMEQLFDDAFSFLCRLTEYPLTARYTFAGKRLLMFELLREGEEEPIYRYRYTSLSSLFKKSKTITESVRL